MPHLSQGDMVPAVQFPRKAVQTALLTSTNNKTAFRRVIVFVEVWGIEPQSKRGLMMESTWLDIV